MKARGKTTREKFPFTTDLGTRMGTGRQNAESLLHYYDEVMVTLNQHKDKNQRASNLLKLLGEEGMMLEISIPVLIWSAFCGPVLRKSEGKSSTIEDVINTMEDCADQVKELISSENPYDELYRLASTKSKSDYYR